MNAWNVTADSTVPLGRPLRRAGLAMAIAGLVHGGIVWGLVMLNTRPVPDTMPESPIRTIVLASTRPQTPSPPEPEPREPEPPQVEPVTVDLDAPPPLPLEPIPLQLDLPQPTLSPIRVSVRNDPKPAPPQPHRPAPPAPPAPAAPTGPMDMNRVDQPPRELAGNPEPAYPLRERRRGIESEVVVRLLIDQQGRVEDVQVVRGGGNFAEVVLQAVRRWRFSPARHHGRTVKVWGLKTFRFELHE